MTTKFIFIILCCLFLCDIVIAQNNQCEWRDVGGVSIPIPPKEHPRLYLRSHHIPELKSRLIDPCLKDVREKLLNMQEDWEPEDIPAEKGWRFYVQQKGLTVRAELNALRYLVYNNKQLGRDAISMVLDTLESAFWPRTSDISRAVGRMMVTSGIVYDWCYDLLTDNEKQRFVKELVRLAKMMECGYPPVRQNPITGHSAEWMIMRDMLSAGIAIYDEYPEMYNYAAGRFFSAHLPVRNWFYLGHAYHQGTSYFNVRFASELFPLWIFDRMGAGNVYHPSQQFVLYDLIYKRRPDGQVLAGGDINYSRKKEKVYSLPMMLAASYYKDEYLNYEFHKDTEIDSRSILFDFLWRDTKLGMKKPDDLPLTKFSGYPFGWMVARTGWDDNSVIVEMKINEYNFLNHMHHDAGAFQIYYKGPLAIDAGSYKGSSGGYNSQHNKNFFKRTIAHNSLLIYDPDEKFYALGYGGSDKSEFVRNDGGQRLPGKGWYPPKNLNCLLNEDYKTGEILAEAFGPDFQTPEFSYLKGDITSAYSKKVKEVKRSFVFFNMNNKKIPGIFIVFDKIVSSNPKFKKIWLLHSIEKPVVNDNSISISRTKNGDSGRLINTAILPTQEKIDINIVGGKGKEFWVFGKNYTNDPIPGTDQANERGEWRVEILPKEDANENYFFNVMQITDNKQEKLYSVHKIVGEKIIGAQIGDRVITYSKKGVIIDRPFSFEIEGKGKYKVLITDLKDGVWQVKKNGKVLLPAVPVKNKEGLIYLTVRAGKYEFYR